MASVCIRDREGEDTDMEKRRRVETAGGLGPFAAVPTLRRMSPPATQYKKLWGTKNNCVPVQLG